MANLGTLSVTLGVDTVQLAQAEAALARFSRSAQTKMTAAINTMVRWGGMAYTFGIRWSMYVTAPIVALSAVIFKVSRDFESSMTKIIALVGESREQVEMWSDELLDLGPSLGQAPKQLAESLYFITSSGISGAKAMEVLQQSAKAASAGLGTVQATADFATSAMNAYRMQNLSAARAFDILTVAVREGKVEGDAFAKEMGQVIPVASQMGVSLEQVAASMAAMSLTGTNAASAAVYLRGILNAILDPAAQAEEALRAMGTSGEEMRMLIQSDLLGALKKLSDLTGQYGISLVSKVIPNVRAMTGFLSLVGENYEHNVQIFKEVIDSQGAMNSAFEEVTHTLEFRYNAALAEMQATALTLGKLLRESFAKALEKVAALFASLSGAVENTIPQMRALIGTVVALTAAMGPLGLAVSAFAKFVLPGLLIMLKAVRQAFMFLNAAIIANPWGAIFAAFTAVAGIFTIFSSRMRVATNAQSDFNDELERSNQLKEELNNVYSQSDMVETMSKLELEAYRKRIQNAIQHQKDLLEIEYHGIQARAKLIEAELKKPVEAPLGGFPTMETDVTAVVNVNVKPRIDVGDLQVVGQVFEDEIKKLEELLVKVNERYARVSRVIKIEPPAIREALEEMRKQIELIDQIAPLMQAAGIEYDVIAKKTDVYKKALQELAPYLDGTDDRVKRIIRTLKALQGEVDSTDEVMRNLAQELYEIETYKAVLGEAYTPEQYAIDQLNAYDKALKELIADGKIAGADFEYVRQRVIQLSGAVDQLRNSTIAWAEDAAWSQFVWEESNKGLSDRIDYINSLISKHEELGKAALSAGNDIAAAFHYRWVQNYKQQLVELQREMTAINILANTMANAFMDIGRVAAGVEGAFEDMVMSMLRGIQQVIGQLLVEAIAAAIDGSMKTSKNPIAGLALAAVTIGGLIALFESNRAKVAKMAAGGIVPAGYPNDSYPALLSSGEAVIPPDKLKEQKPIMGHVDFNIEGRKLRGILQLEEEYIDMVT